MDYHLAQNNGQLKLGRCQGNPN